MGLFSSKKRTYVNTTVSRVMKDSLVPTPVNTGVFRAIVGNHDIVDSIQDEIISTVGFKTNALYSYAKYGNYTRGLPQHTFISSAMGTDIVKSVIENQVGSDVTIVYSVLNGYNHIHRGFKELTDNYGYNHTTNQIDDLTTSKGYKVYLEAVIGVVDTRVIASDDPDVVTEFTPPNTLDLKNWEISPNDRHTPWDNPSKGSSNWVLAEEDDKVIIVYAYLDEVTQEIVREEITFNLDTEGVDSDADYYQAKYYTLDTNNQKIVGYFTYLDQTGLYPLLDTVTDLKESNEPSSFMPMVLFRSNKRNLTAENLQESEHYLSTKKLLEKVNIDYQGMSDSIHENPDIEKIQQAALIWAVPMSTENELEIKYLYSFFNWLYETDPNKSPQLQLTGRPSSGFFDAFSGYGIQQRSIHISEADMNLTLAYDGIASRVEANVIGDVGTITKVTTTEDMSYNYSETVRFRSAGGYSVKERQVTKILPVKVVTFTKQVSPGLVRIIRVAELELSSNVHGIYVSTIAMNNDENLLIPINRELMEDSLSFLERNIVYARGMHFIFNSTITVKTRWYESTIFSAILTIVAIVLLVISIGTSGPVSTALAALAAGTATIVAVIYAILIQVAIRLAIAYGLKRVAELAGPEIALIIAIIAITVGFTTDQTWSANLLAGGMGLADASSAEYASLAAEYSMERSEFIDSAQKELDALAEVAESMEINTPLDPLEMVGSVPITLYGEQPEDYFNRTIHAGNIGTLGFEMVHSYADVSLRLPTIDETLKGFNNDRT
jgi:hypothetical protein